MKRTSASLSLLFVLCFAMCVRADEPMADYIFPTGGQRGTKVDVHVGGTYFHTTAPWQIFGEGVTASGQVQETDTLWFEGPPLHHPESSRKEDYPRDHTASISIAQDAPLGAKIWRVWTSQGATENRVFIVGDLPEVVEQETETGLTPMPVTLPVTINGRIFPREEIDVWSFSAKADQVITCSVAAQVLGSPLIARLEAYDPQGNLLAESSNTAGADPTLSFRTPADGTYQVRIYDVNYEGMQKYVYRLTLTGGPFVQSIYPLGGKRGGKTRFELTGQNVPDAFEYEIPQAADETHTAQWNIGGESTNPVSLQVSDLPEVLEKEPNDTAEKAVSIQLSSVLNGRIGQPGDVDLWSFIAEKEQTVSLNLMAARLGSPLDSMLQVLDAEGKVLAKSDDLAAGQTDSKLTFSAPADAKYFIEVSDRFPARGGKDFAYRLHVELSDSAPDFQLQLTDDVLTVFRDQPLGEDGKPLDRGAKQRPLEPPTLKVDIERINKFDQEIEIIVDGLPPGVTVSGTKVNKNATSTTLKFTAAYEAKIGTCRLKVRGNAGSGEASIERWASLPTHLGASLDHLLLAVALEAPFQIESRFAMAFGSAGSVYEKSYNLHRFDYDGPLEVRLADRQFRHLQGVTGPTIHLSGEDTSFIYPVHLDPWMNLGRTSRSVVMGIATVKDHDGTEHVVSYCSTHQNEQVIAVVKPGILTLNLLEPHVQMQAGESRQVSVRIQRGVELSGQPVHLELVLPLGVSGISMPAFDLPAQESEALLTLSFAADASPPSVPVILRASTTDGDKPVLAEAKLELLPALAQ